MNRTRMTLKNIVWGTLNVITGIILPFVTRTIIIYYLGVEYIGLGSLYNSVLQVLSFTELGLGSALVYSMYEPVSRKDKTTICALLNFYRKSYRVIGILFLVLGCIVAPFIDRFIEGDVPYDVSIYVLFFIYIINNVLSYFIFAEKSSLLLACQRDDANSKIHVVVRIVLNLSQIIVVVLFRNYYAFTICIPILTFVQQLLTGFIAKKLYPEYVCAGKIEKSKLDEIKKNVGGMVFQKIGNITLTSVDTIVISSLLGLKLLGIYNGYYYIFTALNSFLAVILRVLVPSVGSSLVEKSLEKNFSDFQKFHYIYDWIVIWWTACILCLSQPFMQLWAGKELMLPNSMVILLAIYFFFFKWFDIAYVYRESSGIWWEGKWLPIIATVMNLILNIILVNVIGLAGILLSTIISLITVHDTMGLFILKRYCFKELLNMKKFLIKQVAVIVTAVIVGITSLLFCKSFTFESAVITLIVRGLVCLVIPNILLFVLWQRWGVPKDIIAIIDKGIKDKFKRG